MIYFTITAFINIILILKISGTEDSVELFINFKNNYNREYSDPKSEQRGFNNFLYNLAELNKLNKEHPSKTVVYQLNRYADLDPEEIKQHFAIDIKPYDYVEHGNKKGIEREHRHKFLEDLNLYDLNHVDSLYHDWAQKWGKTNFTSKLKKKISYYRFIKTVVEINNKKLAGEDVSLDKDADIVKEPEKYFYG